MGNAFSSLANVSVASELKFRHAEECGMCLDQFDDLRRVPKKQSCGHTLCLACFRANTNAFGTFECPFCYAEADYERRGLEAIQRCRELYAQQRESNEDVTDSAHGRRAPFQMVTKSYLDVYKYSRPSSSMPLKICNVSKRYLNSTDVQSAAVTREPRDNKVLHMSRSSVSRINEDLPMASTSSSRVSEVLPVASTSSSRVSEVLSVASTSSSRVSEVLPVASTSSSRVSEVLPVASTSSSRVSEVLSVASTSSSRVSEVLSVASTSSSHVNEVLPAVEFVRRRDTKTNPSSGKSNEAIVLPPNTLLLPAECTSTEDEVPPSARTSSPPNTLLLPAECTSTEDEVPPSARTSSPPNTLLLPAECTSTEDEVPPSARTSSPPNTLPAEDTSISRETIGFSATFNISNILSQKESGWLNSQLKPIILV
nr:serine-rich adhesin for platelets-like [Cherax quadricarinatus]